MGSSRKSFRAFDMPLLPSSIAMNRRMIGLFNVMMTANVLTKGSLAATLLLSPGAAPTPNAGWTPTDPVSVSVVESTGSGCAAGTTTAVMAPDNTTFTVTYSGTYMARVGNGAAPTDIRKNCHLDLRFGVPPGITFDVGKADYRGATHLAAGTSASSRGNFYLQGTPPTQQSIHSFTSPLDGSWEVSDTIAIALTVGPPYPTCPGSSDLNINTELRIAAGTSDPATDPSYISLDSTNGNGATTYYIYWQPCQVTAADGR